MAPVAHTSKGKDRLAGPHGTLIVVGVDEDGTASAKKRPYLEENSRVGHFQDLEIVIPSVRQTIECFFNKGKRGLSEDASPFAVRTLLHSFRKQ